MWEWYFHFSKLSRQYPVGSVEYCFWASLRHEMMVRKKLWAEQPEVAFKEWLLYLEYKLDSLAYHREEYENG